MKENVIKNKSFAFALRIVKLNNYLQEQKEFVLSKQVLRSGTSIGAMIRESDLIEIQKLLSSIIISSKGIGKNL